MEPWAKRLRELLDAGASRGLTDAGLIKAIGVKQPSVWQWFNEPDGKTFTKMIGADLCVRAAAYVGTTAEFLITGKESKLSSQPARLDLSILTAAIQVLIDTNGEPTMENLMRIYRGITTKADILDADETRKRKEAKRNAEKRRGKGAGEDPGREVHKK
jgi:hypothetical protein